jgi:hypothetical protein
MTSRTELTPVLRILAKMDLDGEMVSSLHESKPHNLLTANPAAPVPSSPDRRD